MGESSKWQSYWDGKSGLGVTDYEFDRGANPRPPDIEALSTLEFLEFVSPQAHEVILDAGCGTGVNLMLLHDRVERIIGIDFSDEAVGRCRRRLRAHDVRNATVLQGSLTSLPLPSASVDKIICMSVLHYLNDQEVRVAFREFARVLRPGGSIVLHVKNIASLYLSTLWLAKRLKMLFGAKVNLEHYRSFDWYRKEIVASGLSLDSYNSFNLLMLEGMPLNVLQFLQRNELRHRNRYPMRGALLRRLGSDLKLKARL